MDGMCGNINHMHVSTKCPPSVCVAGLRHSLHFYSRSFLARGAKETRPAAIQNRQSHVPTRARNTVGIRHSCGTEETASWTKWECHKVTITAAAPEVFSHLSKVFPSARP